MREENVKNVSRIMESFSQAIKQWEERNYRSKSKEAGTVRRLSLELTRALAEMRKSKAAYSKSVFIGSYPHERKIPVIRALRSILGIGLKEAKDLSEQSPPIKVITCKTPEQLRTVVAMMNEAMDQKGLGASWWVR